MGIGQCKSIFGVFVLFLTACGSQQFGATGSVGSGGSYSGESLEGGTVSQVSFQSASQATIDFGSVSDSSKFILSIYSYGENGATEVYQVGQPASLNLPKALMNPLELSEAQEDLTEDLHEWLREEEGNLDESAMLPPKPKVSALVSALGLGSTRNFKVLNSFSGSANYTTVTAVMVCTNENFYTYVDQRDVDCMSADEFNELCSNFNAVVDQERALFGVESDVDGDGHFNILVTREVNELGGASGGIVTGFFYAVDLFSSSVYAQSNQTEVFYTFRPDTEGLFGSPIGKSFALSNILPSVLPHEFQHMINFNMHYFVNGGSPESSFLNESLSHLAEDIYSLQSSPYALSKGKALIDDGVGYMATTGIENPARVSGYLASIDDLCITCGASLYQRGGGYLLLRYLYEQAEKGNLPAVENGTDFLNRIVDTNLTGVGNIVMAAYNSTYKDATFRSLMGQFGLAVFLSDTNLTTDSRLSFEGINLRAAQNDNRGTILRGPAINAMSSSSSSVTNTIGGSSISYIELVGKDIKKMGGSIGIQMSSSGKAGAYLVQTGL